LTVNKRKAKEKLSFSTKEWPNKYLKDLKGEQRKREKWFF